MTMGLHHCISPHPQSQDVRTVIKTPGIWWKDPEGLQQTRWARFSVDRRHHLLSMITMVGPSPDWCVGVSSLNLCLPNCTWSGDQFIDLYPWDAGTDDGVSYMVRNSVLDIWHINLHETKHVRLV
jgi:hypothetical protein